MATLQSVRFISNQRVDLQDLKNIENFICSDLAATHKFVWSQDNYVFNGFEGLGTGGNTLSIDVAGAAAIFGGDSGTIFIGAPSLTDLTAEVGLELIQNSDNYVELYIDQDTGGSDSRAFWDPTANAGEGAEFSQTIDTFIFLTPKLSINTSGFTSDPDKIPLCKVSVGASNISAIEDARPMFFRLGRPSNGLFSFSWVDGRSPESVTTSYDNPDKIIETYKDFVDATLDSIREIRGTTYWYENPFVSLAGGMEKHNLSILTGSSSTSSFRWDGGILSITDDSGVTAPNTDVIANLRMLSSTANLQLTREDISLADGQVLWIELPNPLVDVVYNGTTGATLSEYRISPRGAVPINETTYWLAFCEGTKVYLRGLGELEDKEERQISDETTLALSTYLGFDPETASSVPYTELPNGNMANAFTTANTLVDAISANTANLNDIESGVTQVKSTVLHDQLTLNTVEELETLIASINEELTSPLRMRPNDSGNDLVVNIEDIRVTNPSTARKITITPISNSLPNFSSGSVDFSGGNATPSVGLVEPIPTLAASEYVLAGINLDPNGEIVVQFGIPGTTLFTNTATDASAPPVVSGTHPIGFVVLQDNGTATALNNVTHADIYQYSGSGGGGSGTGDASSLITRLLDKQEDSIYAEMAAVDFSQDEDANVDTGSSTGSYSLVSGKFEMAAGQILYTTDLLSDYFKSQTKTIEQVDLSVIWDENNIDLNAIYEVSRDGINYEIITMEQVATTETFTGTHVFQNPPEATTTEFGYTSTESSTTDFNNNNTYEGKAQVFTLASPTNIGSADLNINVNGSPEGNLLVYLYPTRTDIPGSIGFAGPDEVAGPIAAALPIDLSVLSPGAQTVNAVFNQPVAAGTYAIVVKTDNAYKTAYVFGSKSVSMGYDDSFGTVGHAGWDLPDDSGTSWLLSIGTAGYDYNIDLNIGGSESLLLKVTAGDGGNVAAYGLEYDPQIGAISGIKNIQTFNFLSNTDNFNTFDIGWVADPDLLEVFHVETGQVYHYPAFVINGTVIEFPVNTFQQVSDEDVTLVFKQTKGTSFDNSDKNGGLLGDNHLGSTNVTLDRSVAGRGIFLRRPDGTLRELVINDNDEIEIYSV